MAINEPKKKSNKCCMADKYGGWCAEESWPTKTLKVNENYCIFHAPNNLKNNFGDNINLSVVEKIIEAKEGNTICDFSGARFANFDFDELGIKEIGEVDFSDCKFHGGFIVADGDKGDFVFLEDVSFENSVFEDAGDFNKVKFKKNVIFKGATFNKPALFQDSRFEGNSNFEGIKFIHDVDFSNSKFIKELKLTCIEFKGNVIFKRCEFFQDVELAENLFNSTVIFSGSKFRGDTSFESSKFRAVSEFKEVVYFRIVDFSNTFWKSETRYTDSIFEEEVILNGAEFNGPVLWNKTNFKAEILLNDVKILHNVDFSNSIFQCDLKFGCLEFGGNANFNQCCFQGVADFSKKIFKGVSSFSAADFFGFVSFQGAEFMNDADFVHCNYSEKADYGESLFHGYANFSSSIFKMEASFDETLFKGNVTFSDIEFFNSANFFKTEWRGQSELINTIFHEDAIFASSLMEGANFSGAQFEALATFNSAISNKKVIFIDCTFTNLTDTVNLYVDFEGMRFGGGVDFSSAQSGRTITFKSAVFYPDTFFDDMHINGDIYFDNAEFTGEDRLFYNIEVGRKQYFRDVLILKKLTFKNKHFEDFCFAGTDLDSIRFLNCTWKTDDMNMRRFYDEVLYLQKVDEGGYTDNKEMVESVVKVEELNRQMKRKSCDEMNWPFASIWHVREKNMMLIRAKIQGSRSWGDYFNLIGLELYGSLSHYNESPVRASVVFAWLLLFLVLCAPYGYIIGNFNSGVCSIILDGAGFLLSKLFNTLEFLPFVKTSQVHWDNVSIYQKAAAIFFQVVITIQIGLLGMSIRNKLRR